MTNPPYPTLVLGLTGTRAAGKDTLFLCLHTIDHRFERHAFADALKADVAPLIREKLRYDPDALTAEEKEVVRHLWIGWGMTCRAHSPLHWVNVVIGNIDHGWAWRDAPFVPVVTDVRFENEVTALRARYRSAFKLVNLVREGAPPPTDEEEKHFRKVEALADIHVKWGFDSPNTQMNTARELIARLTAAPVVQHAA